MNSKSALYDFSQFAIWIIAIILFIGTWIEVSINVGTWGTVLGFIPAWSLTWLWLIIAKPDM